MDFGLLFNIVIGALALLRCVLFAVFYSTFNEGEDVHPIYRQACSPADSEGEPLHIEVPATRAA
jgi:hypothetical protein